MRADLRVLWIEDSEEFYKNNLERLQLEISDFGVSVAFDYCKDAKRIKQELRDDQKGFVKYDLFFVDYALSYGIKGNTIIEDLRKMMETDILFYSSDRISELTEAIQRKQQVFMGVYTAERNDFVKMALRLIKKNSRRLLSLTTIRGTIMEQTSENDFIVDSYLRKRFNSVDEKCKAEIRAVLNECSLHHKSMDHKFNPVIQGFIDGKETMDNLLKAPTFLLPLRAKYKIVSLMLQEGGEKNEKKIDDYLNSIVDARNKLAHRKLELSDDYSKIFSFSTIDEYEQKGWGTVDHYSLEEWEIIRKKALEYGELFDSIWEEITKEKES